MQKTKNQRILVIEDMESGTFDKAVLILKENVVREEELVVNEAREVILRYMKKYEKGVRKLKKGKRRVVSHLAATGSGALIGVALAALFF